MTDHVEVTGQGAHLIVPDLVNVRARVQCDADDVASALAQSSARTAVALQAAADHGVDAPDRRTEDVGINPRYDRNGEKVIGYSAYQSVRFTVRDLERVGDLLQALAGAAGDALSVQGIEMSAETTTEALAAAREAAFRDAQERAEQYAELAGAELGDVILIREGGAPDPGPRPMMMARKAEFDGAMPMAAGTQAIQSSVTVRWELT